MPSSRQSLLEESWKSTSGAVQTLMREDGVDCPLKDGARSSLMSLLVRWSTELSPRGPFVLLACKPHTDVFVSLDE
jgi:hypothetical protein